MTRGFRDDAESPLSEGDTVASSYHVARELVRTLTGVLYEARDTLLDRLVALKLAWRDPGIPSLVSEARRCASVRDSCSVQIHGMGMYQGVEYAVAERVLGKLLGEEHTILGIEQYVSRWRRVVAAVARTHESGIAVGDISGSTVLLMPDDRVVLGRLSLSQVPSADPVGHDVKAAMLGDIFGLGSIALELAGGRAPRGAQPERLGDLRPDLPSELSELVDWMLVHEPAGRPRSVQDVLAQLDTMIERLGPAARTVRVLIVDDDTARARWMWGLARRAHPAVVVETAAEGTDAAHKLNRDQPDIVFINAGLRGVMNALELCMYARGLESDHVTLGQMFLIGDVSDRDQALFADVNIQLIANDLSLPNTILDHVRAAFTSKPRGRTARSTVSG
jgi:CheY-like chemotaxis protein